MKKIKLIPILTLVLVTSAFTQTKVSNRTKVKTLYSSLTQVPPSKEEISYLLPLIENGKYEEAANIIIDPYDNGPSNHPVRNLGAFYSVTLQNMVSRWTNTESTSQVPLNDMTATIMGQVKEDRPFKKLFTDDIYYKVNGTRSQFWAFRGNNHTLISDIPSNVPSQARPATVCRSLIQNNPSSTIFVYYQNPDNPNDPLDKKCHINSRYSLDDYDCKDNGCLYVARNKFLLSTDLVQTSNDHYAQYEREYFDMSQTNVLKRNSQMSTVTERLGSIAGIFSTRAWGASFYSAGTNRRAFAYTMKNFMCREMEELNDTTVPDFRIRRDVDRSPGGDPTIFQNKCSGCHAIMDAMGGGFAYYNFNGAVSYEEGQVVSKMNHNSVFENGYVTNDNSWINLMTTGKNSDLGWRGPASGNGAKVFGQAITQSDAFDECITKQVADSVCTKVKYTMSESEYKNLITSQAANFRSHDNLKKLFRDLAIECTKRYQ